MPGKDAASGGKKASATNAPRKTVTPKKPVVAPQPYEGQELLTETQVHMRTGTPLSTLRNWRWAHQTQGKPLSGPAFAHVGTRVVYFSKDVTAWINSLARGSSAA